MPKEFIVPEKYASIEQEAEDVEFAKRCNCMTGQEAAYALSVKYGKMGKPAPQYDWAAPTDYGESGVPTPVMGETSEEVGEAASSAGLLREAAHDETWMQRRLAKVRYQLSQQRNQEIEAFVKKVLQYKDAEHSKEKQTIAKLKKVVATSPRRLGAETGKLFGVNTHGWNVVLSGDRVLHVENRHGTDGEHDESMADLRKWEQIPWIIKHFDEIEKIDKPSHIRNVKNEKSPQILIKKRINGVYFIASAVVDSKNKALYITSVYTGQGRLMMGQDAELKNSPPDDVRNAAPPADNITISQKRGDVKEENPAGQLREDAELDAHLQARRDAMPKIGLEAARANVQAALHREDGETRKAWAKRKIKAVADFTIEKMVDARKPVLDAMREITGDTKYDESVDIPLAMQTSYGRVFATHSDIDNNFVKPILQILADNGLDVETLDTYLVARHAPERNQMIEAFVKKVLQYKDAEHSKEKQTIAKLKKVVATSPRRLGTETEKLFGVNTHGWNVVLSGDRVLYVEKRYAAKTAAS